MYKRDAKKSITMLHQTTRLSILSIRCHWEWRFTHIAPSQKKEMI